MAQAETVINRLASSGVLRRAADYDSFVNDVEPLLRRLESQVSIRNADIRIRFADAPTASALARALDETDRQARRVVAGFERGVRPETLRGRGVRLVPTGRGLRVERADPGSLDVVVALGGLYQAVTSQPLSFALNVAALSGYGRAVLRALRPRRAEPTREISVQLPLMPLTDHEEYHPESGYWETPPPASIANVQIPSDYTTVRIRIESADGSSIEIDCSS